MLLIAGLSSGISKDKSDNGGQKISKSKTNNKDKNNKTNFYNLGDSVKVGKVTYTLNSVQKTDYRNEFADETPNNVIEVTYHIVNNSDDDIPVGSDLEVYGPKNNKLKTYPIRNSTFDSVASGKEMDVTTGFGTDDLGDFELQFSPLISFEKAAKFKVNIQ